MHETTENLSEAARWLGISRQAVWKLDHNRERTGMPPRPWRRGELEAWYRAFSPNHGPRRGIRAAKVDTAS